MIDYYATVTAVCDHCMETHAVVKEYCMGTTGKIYTPCAMCGQDGQDRNIILVFNTEGIMPGNEMLDAHWQGK